MKQEKYIGMERSPGNDLGCRHGLAGQADHGMHPGDEEQRRFWSSSMDCVEVYPWPLKKELLPPGYMTC